MGKLDVVFKMLADVEALSNGIEIVNIRQRYCLLDDYQEIFSCVASMEINAGSIIAIYQDEKIPLPCPLGGCLKEIVEICQRIRTVLDILYNPTMELKNFRSIDDMLREARESAKFLLGKLKPQGDEVE